MYGMDLSYPREQGLAQDLTLGIMGAGRVLAGSRTLSEQLSWISGAGIDRQPCIIAQQAATGGKGPIAPVFKGRERDGQTRWRHLHPFRVLFAACPRSRTRLIPEDGELFIGGVRSDYTTHWRMLLSFA